MSPPRRVSFVGSHLGPWIVERIEAVRGEGLPGAERVAVAESESPSMLPPPAWVLCGVTGHERYVTRPEHEALVALQPPLGRPEATSAALIPIRKSDEWWSFAQDERREIFEERSSHIASSLKYLPAVARRLHHSRELGEEFDFLTWFEYAPQESNGFEELAAALRETEEWSYVEREVDIRLSFEPTAVSRQPA
ncbi:MAG: chlorite dismutase family protein [Actinomycetota bacterium]